jgi:hypothetical protein
MNLDYLSEEELLKLKLNKLNLSIEGSLLESRILLLYSELEKKKLIFKPHIWISEEWFTPDDIAGFAVPFYLIHSKLMRLEKSQMLEAEGARKKECMQILRHETGHAILHAFKLYKKPKWEKIFGSYDKSYPLYYHPDIRSTDYVTHLNAWYAQAHPLEDFAETFAVWLDPASNWKRKYKKWGAIVKLYFVDELMKSLINKNPIRRKKEEFAPLSKLNYTLKEHYKRKKEFYSIEWSHSFDAELQKIFIAKDDSNNELTRFIRRIRKSTRKNINELLDIPQYTVEQLLINMEKRCKELGLNGIKNIREAEKQLLIILTSQIINISYQGYYKIPL